MQKYGLIGYPLKHSFSIGYFNEKFTAENIDAEYVNFEIPRIEDFMEVIEENPNLCGLNVTIPYKEQVIPYLDELDKDTAKIGAVNVIKIIRLPKGKVKLVGYNSDIIGFTQSIEPLLQPHHKKALILGTGGASKAVYRGLENLGIKSTFVSRTKKEDKYLIYEELTPEIMQEYTVIVNCTPVGMYPKVDFCPNIPYELLTPNHLLYDLLYNPNETLFMKKARHKEPSPRTDWRCCCCRPLPHGKFGINNEESHKIFDSRSGCPLHRTVVRRVLYAGLFPETGRPRFTQPQHSRILRFHVRALSRTAPLGG